MGESSNISPTDLVTIFLMRWRQFRCLVVKKYTRNMQEITKVTQNDIIIIEYENVAQKLHAPHNSTITYEILLGIRLLRKHNNHITPTHSNISCNKFILFLQIFWGVVTVSRISQACLKLGHIKTLSGHWMSKQIRQSMSRR